MTYVYFKNLTLNLTNSDHSIPLSNKYDLTNCIWPRYSLNSNQCIFPLPNFVLDLEYKIQFGTNNLRIIEIKPFSSTQNAKFLIRVFDDNNVTPGWVQVNNNNMTVSILSNKVKLVGINKLKFEAQLITTQYPLDNYSTYTTKPSYAFFYFENSNCELISIESKEYLVVDKMMTFNFKFFDGEFDLVIVKMSNSDAVGSYAIFKSPTFSSEISLLSNKISESVENLIFYYTDYYHQDALFLKNITLSVYLFASEPPIFNSELSSIFANRCKNQEIVLPSVRDPDSPNSSNDIRIILDSGTPDWIQLTSNRTLFLDTINNQFQIDKFTNLTIILKDATNAFSKYNLTIDVEPLVVPLFPNATKFYLNCSEDISISIDVESQYDVNTINCNNDTTIKNFNFNKTTSLLNIKLMPAKICKPVCIQFISKDSCNRNVYSNEFWIYFNKIRPPAITNTFGPISVNRGKSKIVKIPSDLFTDSQKLKLELSTTNCIDKSSRFTKIQIFDDNENQKYIYVQSNDTFAFCLFDIYATNSYNISNQYRARLNIIQCASKDCVECNGSYQSDCTKCVQGYEFGDSGACLVSSTLFTLKQFTIYKILGIIVCILIILQLILCIKLKLQSLYSLFYMQTILVMMFSIEDASDEFTVFASSLLWTKFDLGFILFGNYKLLGCQQSSNKMLRLGFYCQSTFYNYMPLIIVVSILVITVIVIKKYFSDSIIIVKCKYYLTFIWNRSILSFVFVPINISPFILSNIIIDGMNLKNQFILTLISIGACCIVLLILCFYCGRIQCDEFINKSDPSNTTCYFYLNMVRIAILSVMFIWNSGTIIYCLFSFILIAIQFCMNLTQFKDNRVLTDELLKEKLANRVVNTHMIFLMFIIWSANIYKTEFIQKICAFMIMEFYMFMLIINLVIKLINIKKQETSKQ